MMAIEDVGILVTLLKSLCMVSPDMKTVGNSHFSTAHLETVCMLYEKIRLPRTTETLERSAQLGECILLCNIFILIV
jgi:hypothetical protein